jgi:hypothetical protein
MSTFSEKSTPSLQIRSTPRRLFRASTSVIMDEAA